MTAYDHCSVARHEPAYAEWLTAHPEGFVLLMKDFTIHRATCPRVRPLRWPARRPGLYGPEAECSTSIAPLEYAMAVFEGAVYLCTRCQPESDPVGVRMHFEYAATLRGHVARPPR